MVNVDDVYQKVLAIANKEQRGYITPQEFNLLANQVQKDIFEQYFYDLNQFGRVPGNDTKYADMVDILEEKISYFKEETAGNMPNGYYIKNITDLYRLTHLVYAGNVIMEQVRYEDFVLLQSTPLTKASSKRPLWYIYNGRIWVSHESENIKARYIRKPEEAQWNYVEINGSPLYDQGSSTHFELHASEEKNLVIKILSLAGVVITDPGLYQLAAQEDQKSIQQEKQ